MHITITLFIMIIGMGIKKQHDFLTPLLGGRESKPPVPSTFWMPSLPIPPSPLLLGRDGRGDAVSPSAGNAIPDIGLLKVLEPRLAGLLPGAGEYGLLLPFSPDPILPIPPIPLLLGRDKVSASA